MKDPSLDFNNPNPIFQSDEDNKWYFYDEIWVDKYGPFESKEECEAECRNYCEIVLGL